METSMLAALCSMQVMFYSVIQTVHVKTCDFHITRKTVKLFPFNISAIWYIVKALPPIL